MHGATAFHDEGDIDKSCLTFMHGGEFQNVEREISSLRAKGNLELDLSWFFTTKHAETSKDQLILQVAFQGDELGGAIYSYTTSQLHYETKGWGRNGFISN